MKHEKLKIKNRNGIALNASIDMPIDKKVTACAIFAHCFTCNSNLNAVRNISQSLTEKGLAVVRFDFTGLGKSEGEFADSHFAANVEDLEDVNQFITENYEAPTLLIGHSLGGAAAIVAGQRLDNIKAIATIGAPSSPIHTAQHFEEQYNQSENENVSVTIAGRPFNINQNFIENFKSIDVPEIAHELKKPLLIMHAPHDEIVSIKNAEELYTKAFHPKSFVSLDKADHLLTHAADSQYAGSVIATWVQRYFTKFIETELNTDGEQIVGHLDLVEDNFTTTLQTNSGHTLLADEPKSVGGDNLGPAPYDLVNAGLAACTVMTVKMYAARKKWDLKEAYAYVSHNKVKNEAGETIDKYDKKLKLIGNLDDKQRTRIKEIAAKCPVHKTLESAGTIATELID